VVAWIDVEGANEPILGAGSVLERVAAIFIEVERETTWEGQWLDTDVNHCLRGHRFLPVARDVIGGRPHQYNVVFLPAEDAQLVPTAQMAARVLHPGSAELDLDR
jgi:hypothetical protein